MPQLVQDFVVLSLAQAKAGLYSDHDTYHRLFDATREIMCELKSRAGDQRRAACWRSSTFVTNIRRRAMRACRWMPSMRVASDYPARRCPVRLFLVAARWVADAADARALRRRRIDRHCRRVAKLASLAVAQHVATAVHAEPEAPRVFLELIDVGFPVLDLYRGAARSPAFQVASRGRATTEMAEGCRTAGSGCQQAGRIGGTAPGWRWRRPQAG